jgi:glutamate dehydrogenase
VDEVAPLHFLLGGGLELHWLADRIAALPRDNRWQAMARAALRDDLFALHSALTADVLTGGPQEGSARERLDKWAEANAGAVERTVGILGDIKSAGTYDLTTLPVALREVRNLIQSTTQTPSTGDAAVPAATAS